MVTEVPLTQGYVALIDDADAELILARTWHAKVRRTTVRTTVYAGTNVLRDPLNKRKGYRWTTMHRFLMSDPQGQEVDHIDGNGLNNTRANLRVCSHSENMRNRRAYGKSQFLGVVRGEIRKRTGEVGRWVATIGKRRLGSFRTEIEAANAYDAAAMEEYGEFARLNFPDHSPHYQKQAADAVTRRRA